MFEVGDATHEPSPFFDGWSGNLVHDDLYIWSEGFERLHRSSLTQLWLSCSRFMDLHLFSAKPINAGSSPV